MVNIICADRSQDPYDQLDSEFFTLKVIKAATQHFNSANVISQYGYHGEDLIFKGVLPNGTPIQVRPIPKDTDGRRKVISQYLKNMDLYLALRHPNINRLLGHYSDKHSLLLVYEHMDVNGDLYTALHGGGDLKKRLDWKTRIEICLGIAKGLAFLHQRDESKPLIVHRDIHPTNIFLDEHLKPKISGFDVARFCRDQDTDYYTKVAKFCKGEDTDYYTKVWGTLGYIDPEYYKGTVNDKTDVYSFGVLALELLGGKKPNAGFDGSRPCDLVSFANELHETGDLIPLLDDDLRRSFPLKEATMILNLAVSCTASIRKLRPTMSEVVSVLEEIRINTKTPEVDHQYFLEHFSQFEIKAAAENFNKANMMRTDAFGRFYQEGVLPNGMPVTVRRFSRIVQSGRKKVEFQNEIDSLLPLRHKNIVKILGHYSDKFNLLLVYEHIENGDLQMALFGEVNLKKSLDWKTRVQICHGIAKGLAFLQHKDQTKPLIVHRYIQPANILLDKHFNPKISGFGEARLCEGENTHHTTEVIGTLGYLDPEYFIQGTINDKTDVYSFGVLILVLFSGKSPTYKEEGSDSVDLASFAKELKEKGNLSTLMDKDLRMQYSMKEATMILNLAILCTNTSRKLRPTMSEVVNILEGKTAIKTPEICPLSLAEVRSEVDASNIDLNISKETELTDEGFVSDFIFGSDEIGGEASASSEVVSELLEENQNLEYVESGSIQKGLHETGSLTFRRIEVATINFNPANMIGEGSTSSVYRGMLPNGKIVAVKQLLMKSDLGKKVFLNEINTMSSLKHPNLVRLLWHCAGNNQHSIVYEYMENGSLYSALFENVKDQKLTWTARVKICIGVAKGFSFLHDDNSKIKIVHRDIKLSNILLDKDLNPRISDFGLAINYNREITHISTSLAGTIGYMAPEYVMRGTVTEKIDVYSFGIVMLELITGKKRAEWISDHESVSILDMVYDLQQKGDALELIDQDLKMNIPVKEAEMMLSLAMLCTNPDPKSRPTMSEVVSILEGRTMIETNTPCNLQNEDCAAISVCNLTSASTHPRSVFSSNSNNDGMPTILSTHVGSQENDAEFRNDSVSGARVSMNKVRLDCVFVEKGTVESEPPLSNEVTPEREYTFVEPSFTEEGKLHVMCTDEEFEAGCKEWKNSLVGFFMGKDDNFDIDNEMVKKLWEVKGDFSVFSMDNGYFIFQFSCVEEKKRVLQSADLWQIQQRPMILREWDWKLDFNRVDEMDSLPIWVKIYNLPLFLWTPSFLSKIGSGLGILLFADQKTKSRERLAYAMLFGV